MLECVNVEYWEHHPTLLRPAPLSSCPCLKSLVKGVIECINNERRLEDLPFTFRELSTVARMTMPWIVVVVEGVFPSKTALVPFSDDIDGANEV